MNCQHTQRLLLSFTHWERTRFKGGKSGDGTGEGKGKGPERAAQSGGWLTLPWEQNTFGEDTLQYNSLTLPLNILQHS